MTESEKLAQPRMGKLRRALTLVHMLSESVEGLTLDEMAAELGVTRRTVERLRDALEVEFDIQYRLDDRVKRFGAPDRGDIIRPEGGWSPTPYNSYWPPHADGRDPEDAVRFKSHDFH